MFGVIYHVFPIMSSKQDVIDDIRNDFDIAKQKH